MSGQEAAVTWEEIARQERMANALKYHTLFFAGLSGVSGYQLMRMGSLSKTGKIASAFGLGFGLFMLNSARQAKSKFKADAAPKEE